MNNTSLVKRTMNALSLIIKVMGKVLGCIFGFIFSVKVICTFENIEWLFIAIALLFIGIMIVAISDDRNIMIIIALALFCLGAWFLIWYTILSIKMGIYNKYIINSCMWYIISWGANMIYNYTLSDESL